MEVIPMFGYQLVVITGPGRNVLARVAGMVIPLDIEIIGMHLSPASVSGLKWLQLSVRVPSESRLELLIKRLNRMVDVTKVVVLEPEAHHRQSTYVLVRPQVGDTLRVSKIILSYGAETLEVTDHRVLVHLNASPDSCAAFVADLEPFDVVEAVSGSVASFRSGLRPIGHVPQAVRVGL
jgi:acetolactate synthase-1/3 small subunit